MRNFSEKELGKPSREMIRNTLTNSQVKRKRTWQVDFRKKQEMAFRGPKKEDRKQPRPIQGLLGTWTRECGGK